MWSQRTLLGLVAGLAAVGIAAAQASGNLRWRAGMSPLGLQSGQNDLRLPCGSFTFSCDAATVPLYASAKAPRTLSMQVTSTEGAAPLRMARAPGLNVSLVGKAGIARDLGVYGRVGTNFNRATPTLASMGNGEGGLTYGVGLSWDFARSASAAVGLDSYDIRGSTGDVREVRTSLGLQWRY
jgi:OOP family OmpA-OmpF porin